MVERAAIEEKYEEIKDWVYENAVKNETFLFGGCEPPDEECRLHASCMGVPVHGAPLPWVARNE